VLGLGCLITEENSWSVAPVLVTTNVTGTSAGTLISVGSILSASVSCTSIRVVATDEGGAEGVVG
jgi:hypothetical protein